MDLTLTLLASLVSLVSSQTCPPNFIQYGLSCYFFNRVELTWFDADQVCTGLLPNTYNVHLAAIETRGEQDFLSNALRGNSDMRNRDAWVSMTRIDRNRNWVWAKTYQVPRFLNWAPGEPSGDGKCVHMWERHGYAWDDAPCDSTKGSVCEYRMNQISPPSQCPSGFLRNGNSCYYFVPSSQTWFEADQYCTYFRPRTYDTHLVSVESLQEHSFLVNTIRNNNDLRERNFWIGGNNLDRRRTWVWAGTDRPLSFFRWAPGEPNGSGECIQMWSSENWSWDDAECADRSTGFICEYELS